MVRGRGIIDIREQSIPKTFYLCFSLFQIIFAMAMTLSAITRHGKWSESGTSSLAEKDETEFWLGSSCQHNTDNPDLPNDVWIRRTFYWNRKCYFRPSFQVVNLCLNIGLNCYCNVSLQFLLDWYLVSKSFNGQIMANHWF